MFICNKKDKEIKFFDGKSLKKISGDFSDIFPFIQKKYNKIDNFYIGYYGNKKCDYTKNVLIFIPRFGKLFEFDSDFYKNLGIKTLLSYLNTYKGRDLDNGNNIIDCEIYGSLIKKRHIKISNYQDLVKATFIYSTTKDKDSSEYISYSYAPFFRGNYTKKAFIENAGVGVDLNKTVAIQKSLSENIERASASEFLYKDMSFKRKKFVTLAKHNKEIISLYNNEYKIPNTMQGVELKGLTTKKTIFLPKFLVFYPTKQKCQYNACSSGMATHLDIEKAILGGMLELIEGDSFIYSRLSYSESIYRIPNSFVNKIGLPLKSNYHFSFFLLDSLVPIPTVLTIMEKGGKKCVSLGTAFSLKNALKKSYQESINSKPLFRNMETFDKNSEVMSHTYYYLNPENGNKLDRLEKAPLLNIDNIKQEIYNQESLISWCRNHNINFFFYEFKNELNKIFKRRTVRVFSPELLPIYFGEKMPSFVTKNKRIKILTVINTDIHPLG